MSPVVPLVVVPRQSGSLSAVDSDVVTETSQPTVAFVYPQMGGQDTCTQLFIKWTFNGPDTISNNIALWITNQGLVRSSTSTTDTGSITHTRSGSDVLTPSNTVSTSSRSPEVSIASVTQAIAVRALPTDGDSFPITDSEDSITIPISSTTFPAESGNMTLDKITVPAGIYVIAASFPDSQWSYTQRSLPFKVFNGSDTSCVGSIPTAPIDTGTPLPAGSVSSNSGSNKGAIAGGVIGGLAILVAVLFAILFYRYKHNRLTRLIRAGNQRGLNSQGNAGHWNRLGDHIPATSAYNGDRKPPIRDYGTDVKSPTAFTFNSSTPGAANDQSGEYPSPTFIRAPAAARDPFSDPPGHQIRRSIDNSNVRISPEPIMIIGHDSSPNVFHTPAAHDNIPSTSMYPATHSENVAGEDMAAIWGGNNNSSDTMSTSSSGNPSRGSQRRKPVPAYNRESVFEGSDIDKEPIRNVPLERVPTEAGERNIMGKEMHFLVSDPPTEATAGKF